MRNNNLTAKKILRKLERKELLTHNEELFYLVEVLHFSEEKAEQMLMPEKYEAKKLKVQPDALATAA
ncbi:MAG TPA: hypothetical protein VGG71_12715 [Chitinophagaceae bacterium]